MFPRVYLFIIFEMSARSKDKVKNSPLTVKIPVLREYTVDKLAKWLNSFEEATDVSLDSFSISELKLIILCAKDREISYRNLSKTGIDSLRTNLASLSDNMMHFTKSMEENVSALVNSCNNTLKTYADVATEKEETSVQLRNILTKKIT